MIPSPSRKEIWCLNKNHGDSLDPHSRLTWSTISRASTLHDKKKIEFVNYIDIPKRWLQPSSIKVSICLAWHMSRIKQPIWKKIHKHSHVQRFLRIHKQLKHKHLAALITFWMLKISPKAVALNNLEAHYAQYFLWPVCTLMYLIPTKISTMKNTSNPICHHDLWRKTPCNNNPNRKKWWDSASRSLSSSARLNDVWMIQGKVLLKKPTQLNGLCHSF